MKTLPGRLELPTLRLTASRSNQLSYGSLKAWDRSFMNTRPRAFDGNARKRAHPDLNQGPADLQSAALTTELCTHLLVFWTAALEKHSIRVDGICLLGWPDG